MPLYDPRHLFAVIRVVEYVDKLRLILNSYSHNWIVQIFRIFN